MRQPLLATAVTSVQTFRCFTASLVNKFTATKYNFLLVWLCSTNLLTDTSLFCMRHHIISHNVHIVFAYTLQFCELLKFFELLECTLRESIK